MVRTIYAWASLVVESGHSKLLLSSFLLTIKLASANRGLTYDHNRENRGLSLQVMTDAPIITSCYGHKTLGAHIILVNGTLIDLYLDLHTECQCGYEHANYLSACITACPAVRTSGMIQATHMVQARGNAERHAGSAVILSQLRVHKCEKHYTQESMKSYAPTFQPVWFDIT